MTIEIQIKDTVLKLGLPVNITNDNNIYVPILFNNLYTGGHPTRSCYKWEIGLVKYEDLLNYIRSNNKYYRTKFDIIYELSKNLEIKYITLESRGFGSEDDSNINDYEIKVLNDVAPFSFEEVTTFNIRLMKERVIKEWI